MVLSKNKKIKICLAASAGGHISQLLKLAESWKGYETFWVTTSDVVREKLQEYSKVYIVGECNREHPFRALLVTANCIKIILKEKPDVIISTGAAPPCILCLIGKLFGARIVWVDSIANVARLSLSASIVRPFADIVLTQWPEVAGKYANVEYVGAVV